MHRCPSSLCRLEGAHDAIVRGDGESLAQALTSCRRALEAIADAVFPAAAGVRVDRHGVERPVGPSHFRNRLALFLEDRVASRSRRDHDVAMLDTLVAQLKRLMDGINRGVHGEVEADDARRVYAATVQLLAELARHDR